MRCLWKGTQRRGRCHCPLADATRLETKGLRTVRSRTRLPEPRDYSSSAHSLPSALTPARLRRGRSTRRRRSGTRTRGSSTTRSGATRRRSCAWRSTRPARCSRRGPWTTRQRCAFARGSAGGPRVSRASPAAAAAAALQAAVACAPLLPAPLTRAPRSPAPTALGRGARGGAVHAPRPHGGDCEPLLQHRGLADRHGVVRLRREGEGR